MLSQGKFQYLRRTSLAENTMEVELGWFCLDEEVHLYVVHDGLSILEQSSLTGY